MHPFENLFTPIKIGHLQLKNRIIMAATGTNFNTPGGEITEKLKSFLKMRAQGGAGLIIAESAYICDSGRESTYQLAINRDELVPDLRTLTADIQKEDTKIFLQLNHAGRQTFSNITGMDLVAPSPVPCQIMRGRPRELEQEEIESLAIKFGEAARRAKEAGFDGVELLAGHGHLINQFLSPYTNKRNDQYGGTLENRFRFPLQVLDEIKRNVGMDFPVSVRISAEEFVPGGITLRESMVFAKVLLEHNADMLQISGGIYETRPMIVQPMLLPLGLFAQQAKSIKETLESKIPISTAGRIKDPHQAERLIQEDYTDLVSMARPLLADPYFPKKSQEGRTDEIRKCISCNQGCMDRFIIYEKITCLGNPYCGFETERKIHKSDHKKKVMVIGGGPGGMEAARVAALKGHEVLLFEKEKELGKQIELAALPPGKNDVRDLKQFLINQVNQLGVHIYKGCHVDKNMVDEVNPDAVIMATGSKPIYPDIPGISSDHVMTAEALLGQNLETGNKILVVGGGLVGCETAYYLAEQGKEVLLTEAMRQLGVDIGPFYKGLLLSYMHEHQIKIYTRTTVKEITENAVTVEIQGEKTSVSNVDSIVLAVGHEPDNALFDQLNTVYEVYKIGDCNEIGKILDAIHEGFDCANSIGAS